MKHFSFIVFILFLSLAAYAQESWEYFTSKQNVNCIDFEGDYIWIGATGYTNDAGIVRINTRTNTLEHFDYNDRLTYLNVKAMAIDSSGTKWFSLYKIKDRQIISALFSFDDSHWTQYTTDNSDLPSNTINALKVNAKGHLYIGTDNGLVQIINGNWTIYNTDNSEILSNFVKLLEIDQYDNIWMSTVNGVSNFSGNSWTHFNEIEAVQDIEIDIYGNIWCGIGDDWPYGIKIIKPDGSINEYSFQNSNLPRSWVKEICIDDDYNVWLTTGHIDRDEGITLIKNGDIWESFDTENSILPTLAINTIKKDKHNNIWIGTEQGLVKVENNNWIEYPLQTISQHDVYKILLDKNNGIWFGGYPGASYLNNNHWYNYNKNNSGLGTNWVQSITLDNYNNVWFSTMSEEIKYVEPGVISKYDGNVWTIYNKDTDPIINKSYSIRELTFDKENNLWFVQDGWLVKFNGSIWQYIYPPNIEKNPYINSIYVDKLGNIWFSTYEHGILKYSNDQWTSYNNENSELNTSQIGAILSDNNNNIWVKTTKGISCFDGIEWKNIENEANQNGIIRNAFALDSTGAIWQSTAEALYKYANETWTRIDSTDIGIPLDEINYIQIDQHNNKWISTDDYGLIKLGQFPTGIDETETVAISGYHLLNNFPNPFNGTTTLSYTLQYPGQVNITIYNMLGQKVSTLVDRYQTALQNSVKWNGTNDFGEPVSSGIYFARMQSGNYTQTIKMAFVE